MIPDIEYETTGRRLHGRRLWLVTKGGEYEAFGKKILVETGFLTDLATIPRVFFLLTPNDSRWAIPSIIHDRACQMARREEGMSYKLADSILYKTMMESGSGAIIATLFWLYVRANHILNPI